MRVKLLRNTQVIVPFQKADGWTMYAYTPYYTLEDVILFADGGITYMRIYQRHKMPPGRTTHSYTSAWRKGRRDA